jgi:hypothetical protein
MTRTSLRIRLLTASAALAITFMLFQTVASFSRPTAIEQLAQAKKATVTVALAREPEAGVR